MTLNSSLICKAKKLTSRQIEKVKYFLSIKDKDDIIDKYILINLHDIIVLIKQCQKQLSKIDHFINNVKVVYQFIY